MIVFLSEKPVDATYNLKGFLCTHLKPVYKLLFDVVHKIFLSQTDTNEQVTHEKFKIMVVVFHNLNINLCRILVANMKGEMKKIVRQFNAKGLLLELNVKRRLNFCSKISLIIMANYELAEWASSVEFNSRISACSRCRWE